MVQTEKADIIIVGAGACGLLAARQLARSGKSVLILEAQNRIGGRIHTINDDKFAKEIELGAEFIHGKMELTTELLDEYGIEKIKVGGRFYRKTVEGFRENEEFLVGADELAEKLRSLETDMSVEDFLHQYFKGEEHSALRNSVKGFIEGYDAGDISRFSTLTFRQEWLDDDWEQFRIKGGYGALMTKLAEDLQGHGAHIMLNECVKEINWSKEEVIIQSASGKSFIAEKVIVTVPLGILLSDDKSSSIKFSPSIDAYKNAAKELGYGPVIKVILRCDKAFWKEWDNGALSTLGFLFSNSPVSTWWTQLPDETPILSGWMGGSRAKDLEYADEQKLLQIAYDSLHEIFGKPVIEHIISAYAVNWAANPYSLGAYSWASLGREKHIAQLKHPLNDTLYFAGEALNIEKGNGTVESALRSALDVVKSVLREHLET